MKKVDRLKETTKVQERIEALEGALELTTAYGDGAPTINIILQEYKDRRQYLKGAKEYMVHFEGGGWNTCYGQDEECALVNAKMEHETNDDVKGIDQDRYAHKELKVRSVSLATSAGIEAAMRLFY